MKYILCHDLGTSANKAVLVSLDGSIRALSKAQYEVLYPKEGYAEQNPQDWWDAVVKTTREVVQSLGAENAEAIAFSTQMAGVLPMDERGEPLMNCMIWLDTRAAREVFEIIGSRVTRYNLINLIQFLRITGGCSWLCRQGRHIKNSLDKEE